MTLPANLRVTRLSAGNWIVDEDGRICGRMTDGGEYVYLPRVETDTTTGAVSLVSDAGNIRTDARVARMATGSQIFNAGLLLPTFCPFEPRQVWQYLRADKLGVSRSSTADQLTAIEAAIAIATAAGCALYLPAHLAGGYRYSAAFEATCPIFGDGPDDTILLATTEADSAVEVASDCFLYGLSVRQSTVVSRSASNDAHGILLQGASNVWVAHCAVYGVAGSAFYSQGVQRAAFEDILSSGSMADGFHVRPGASGHTVQIHGNRYTMRGCGDDGLAFISYGSENAVPDTYRIKGAMWSNVDIQDQATTGRGIAVLGADDVDLSKFVVRRSIGAGLYLGSDAGNHTQGTSRVRISDGVLDECGGGASMASLHLRADANDTASGLLIEKVAITKPRRHCVYASLAAGSMTDVTLSEVSMDGAGQTTALPGVDINGIDGLVLGKCDIRNVRTTGAVFGANCNNVTITDLTGRNVNTTGDGSQEDFLRFATATSKAVTLGNIALQYQDTRLHRLIEVGTGWTVTTLPGTSRTGNYKDGLGTVGNVVGYSDPAHSRTWY